MTTGFRPANSPIPPTPNVKVDEMTTPTTPTPRPACQSTDSQYRTAAPPQSVPASAAAPAPAVDDATTPTRASFGAALAAQKPLPSSPFPQAVQMPDPTQDSSAHTPKRENSQHSRKSGESDDVEMEESDGGAEAGDEGAAGSDDESVNADGSRSNKKKKSQRFYCTDYPPCNLSFTRSEHLARHIRKHTGERPFQCHCSRRFSRLDNLRQHAQTVHVNEDIPLDSLAATGSRYQRQIRTERVRPTTGRARASTAGSLGAPVRGHSKSLSTSSIASVSSVGSAFSAREDFRRRPPPLVMSNHSARLSTESYRSVADSSYSYRHPSPSDFSAPTSATLSTNQSSPRWSCAASPTNSHVHSRSQSMYTANRERRLSVPSGVSPFQSPLHGPPPTMPPTSGTLLTPPQQSAWSGGRRDSLTSNDDGYRRRTWHPDTRHFTGPTSNLSSVANSSQFHINLPAPLAEPRSNSQSTVRLPGIESFDTVARPATPPRRAPSPMMVDSDVVRHSHHSSPMQHPHQHPHPHPQPQPQPQPQHPQHAQHQQQPSMDAETGLHRGLHKLDISTNNTPPRDSADAWATEAETAVQAQAEHVRLNAPTVRFETNPSPSFLHANTGAAMRALHQHTMSAPSMSTPRELKRHGWYNGPMHSDDARVARVERMVHPNVAEFTGFPSQKAEAQPLQAPQQPHHREGTGNVDSLRRLEALVAVATNEGNPPSQTQSPGGGMPAHAQGHAHHQVQRQRLY